MDKANVDHVELKTIFTYVALQAQKAFLQFDRLNIEMVWCRVQRLHYLSPASCWLSALHQEDAWLRSRMQ